MHPVHNVKSCIFLNIIITFYYYYYFFSNILLVHVVDELDIFSFSADSCRERKLYKFIYRDQLIHILIIYIHHFCYIYLRFDLIRSDPRTKPKSSIYMEIQKEGHLHILWNFVNFKEEEMERKKARKNMVICYIGVHSFIHFGFIDDMWMLDWLVHGCWLEEK